MTSLKAIFTGKKRFSLSLILLFTLSLLSAADFRIGLISESNTGISYVDNFSALLSFSSRIIENESLIESARISDEERERREFEKSLSSAIRAERDTSSIIETVSDKSSYSSSIVPVTITESDRSFILEGNSDAIGYIKLVNDVDELYFISIEEEDGLSFVDISLDGRRIFSFVYSEFVTSSAEEEIITYLLLHYRGTNYALVSFSGNTESDIFLSNERPERYRNYIVLPFGLHHIRITSAGFIPYEFDLLVDETRETVEFTLERVRTVPLFISTSPYTSEIYYLGNRVEGGYVEETTYPFSVIVRAPGFEPRSIQSDVGTGSLSTPLLPTELYSSSRVDEKKNQFYTHLLVTLLTFGGSVATNVVSDIYTLENLAPLSLAFQGVSIIELIMTLNSLFEYRDALRYGI